MAARRDAWKHDRLNERENLIITVSNSNDVDKNYDLMFI